MLRFTALRGQKIWRIIGAILANDEGQNPTRAKIWPYLLVLFTHRKLYASFPLVRKSVTLNDLDGQYDFMVIFSEVTEKECVKMRYPALDSETSNCARLCGHLSNS